MHHMLQPLGLLLTQENGAKVFQITSWPARLEYLLQNPLDILLWRIALLF